MKAKICVQRGAQTWAVGNLTQKFHNLYNKLLEMRGVVSHFSFAAINDLRREPGFTATALDGTRRTLFYSTGLAGRMKILPAQRILERGLNGEF
jgi:hypothetical protein